MWVSPPVLGALRSGQRTRYCPLAARPLALPTVSSASPAQPRSAGDAFLVLRKQGCFLQKNPDAVYATSPESQCTVLF